MYSYTLLYNNISIICLYIQDGMLFFSDAFECLQ